MTAYEKEKAYCARRAAELTAEMEAALEAKDPERFKVAYSASARYMRQKERKPLYLRFLALLGEIAKTCLSEGSV